MIEKQAFNILLYAMIGIALIIAISLTFITAPYGRHAKKGWGPLVNDRLGWVLMEAPASLLFLMYFLLSDRSGDMVMIVFLIIWQAHYFHRTFIFPFTLRPDNGMPFSIMFFGIIFNAFNTFIQGNWLYFLAPAEMYTKAWLTDPRFIIGVIIFFTGFVINKHADAVLRSLRAPDDKEYKIPYGGLYRFISCPNYFGEMVTWLGWAILTWSLAGGVFFIWTLANLVPRARSNHKWYLDNFPDYPGERKALIPFLF